MRAPETPRIGWEKFWLLVLEADARREEAEGQNETDEDQREAEE